jgi:serine/alanine adding enzyme
MVNQQSTLNDEVDASVDAVAITVDPSPAAWDAFVDQHPDATGYHVWAWREVFARAFGHRAVYLAAMVGSPPAIAGILPLVVLDTWLFGRFAVSLPFVNYGGIVASDARVRHTLVREAASLARRHGWKHIEIRHLEQYVPDWAPKRHKVAMMLPLPPTETALWEQLDRKVRNQVRKAQKSGFTTAVGGTELAREFYQVFARTMHDLGTPVYGRRFFDELLRAFPDRARVFLIRHDMTPVAASVTVGWRSVVEVPWAASLKEYRSQCPNMLLYWEMLRAAVAEGRGTFDFGRSTPDEGTFHFKRQWGAEAQPMCWEYWLPPGQSLPDHSPHNPKFAMAVKLWQHLPLRVTTRLGPHVVRGIP